jgi:hypothetical protein
MINIIVLWQTVYTQAANGHHPRPRRRRQALPTRPPHHQPQRPLPNHHPPAYQRTPTPPHPPMTSHSGSCSDPRHRPDPSGGPTLRLVARTRAEGHHGRDYGCGEQR